MEKYRGRSIEQLTKDLEYLQQLRKTWEGHGVAHPRYCDSILRSIDIQIKWVRHYRTPWLYPRPRRKGEAT